MKTKTENWRSEAYAAFKKLIKQSQEPFITLEFRKWLAKNTDVREPQEPRAWGGIVKMAYEAGHIRRFGKIRAPHVHGCTVTIWTRVWK